MTITRGKIKFDVLTRLNKTAQTFGQYTDDKLNQAIAEGLDYISTEMFLADEGWANKLDYVTTQANQVTVPIQPHWAMISELRYLINGLNYAPLGYDQQFGQAKWASQSGVTQYPNTYAIIDNQLYFTPALACGGTNYLEVQYFAYPKVLTKDTDFVDSQFDRCMYWFLVYFVCNTCSGQYQQTTDDWDAKQAIWYNRMKDIISMRTRQCIAIREFEG